MSSREARARWLCMLTLTIGLALGAQAADRDRGRRAELPLDERLHFDISWLGVHCGEMTLESAPVEGKPALVRMLMTLRSSELFDRIYRVRGEIESVYNVRRGSTLRFHERSSEQNETKDDLWVVAPAFGRARRTLNGEQETFDIPRDGAHDPLALLYRIRSLATEPGTELTLTAMTTGGSLEVPVRVERWERFETPSGAATALKVVQPAVGDAEFGRGGGMTMWLAADDRRTPLRIEFDLPFGTLIAELTS